ncbi:MAG: D-2-hydroxyacid dehydrogenase, partial [Prevotella sp.]
LTNKVVIGRSVMEALPRLKYIGVLATGYNVVDTQAARERGIVVTNVPAYSTDSVVQMTLAHLLNITNRVGHYADQNRNGRWSTNADFCYWDTPLPEIAGKTMGIVGLGSIGMKVATTARCLGLDVFAYTSKESATLPEGIQKTTLDGLLGASDILSLHCPLTDTTRGMINSETLGRMKPGAILINTSRGQLVDEKAVAEALTSGHLGGYGADVMCEEPPAANNPLFSAPNAFITPHIAWATREARQRLMDTAVANVKAFANGKPVNVVNK